MNATDMTMVGSPRRGGGETLWSFVQRLGMSTVEAHRDSARSAERGAERSGLLAEKAVCLGERVAIAALQSNTECGQQAAKIAAGSSRAFENLLQEAESSRLSELCHTYQMMRAISKMAPDQAVAFAAECAQTVKGQIESMESKKEIEWRQAQAAEEMDRQQQSCSIRQKRLDQAKSRLKNVLASFKQSRENIGYFGMAVGCGAYFLTRNVWAAGVVTGGGLWAAYTVQKWLYGDESVKNKWVQIYQGAIERMESNPKLTPKEAVKRESPQSKEWENIPEDEEEGLFSIMRRAERSAHAFDPIPASQ